MIKKGGTFSATIDDYDEELSREKKKRKIKKTKAAQRIQAAERNRQTRNKQLTNKSVEQSPKSTPKTRSSSTLPSSTDDTDIDDETAAMWKTSLINAVNKMIKEIGQTINETDTHHNVKAQFIETLRNINNIIDSHQLKSKEFQISNIKRFFMGSGHFESLRDIINNNDIALFKEKLIMFQGMYDGKLSSKIFQKFDELIRRMETNKPTKAAQRGGIKTKRRKTKGKRTKRRKTKRRKSH